MAEMNFRWAITYAMQEEMERDENVFLIGEDVGKPGGAFGMSRGLFDRFGEWRVRDTPISEEAFMGLAAGAALVGLRPIVEIMFMDFIMVAMEPLCNQAAKFRYAYGGAVKVPMVVRALYGAGWGAAAHHSQSLEAWFVHCPGLKVVAPSGAYDAKGLLKASIRDDNPVVFLEHKLLLPVKEEVPEQEYLVPLGRAAIKREGSDVSIVAWGWQVQEALRAAAQLAEEGIQAEVVDLRSLSPLDEETILNSVRKTGRLVVVQEAPAPCGFASEVICLVSEKAMEYLDAPPKRVTAFFAPMPSGPLEKYIIPQQDDIISGVQEVCR
ncbi:MAG TPA: alpha-ketoacid dehydrogenase subunit beta [Dehalococcoidia bacterium]|nr:alpha-ketoacid dehydrogenase subunit beta [Dehalococcoidia bacterium]